MLNFFFSRSILQPFQDLQAALETAAGEVQVLTYEGASAELADVLDDIVLPPGATRDLRVRLPEPRCDAGDEPVHVRTGAVRDVVP